MFQVNGRPFLMLAGEAHNSSSSSLAAVTPVLDKAVALGLNSVLLPVTWELVEPDEGAFDFSLVDMLLREARSRGLKLGLLWFGAWKNAQCYYAPAWVKTDLERFHRAQVVKGKNKVSLPLFYGMEYTSLSAFCPATLAADSRAFARLMAHLKQADGDERTVVYVQVENETGLQGAVREHSDEADALFAADVPQDFADYMRGPALRTLRPDMRRAVEEGQPSGSWEAVFGPLAEELFQAYHVAGYVDAVAAAGKAEYDLPTAVNAWLEINEPGNYPSGGPIGKMLEVWKFRAPHIDILCPDIYVRHFCDVCDEFHRLGNPLLIPETAAHSHAAPRLIYTVGHHHAWGFAPFGFEEIGGVFSAGLGFLFGMDTSDPLLSTPQNAEEYAWLNRTLHELTPLLAKAYGTDDLQAVIGERPDDNVMRFGPYAFRIVMDSPMQSRKDSACLALKVAEDEFYLIGMACRIQPLSVDPDRPNVDLLRLEDGEYRQGQWQPLRRLNGDEANIHCDAPTLLRVKLFRYA